MFEDIEELDEKVRRQFDRLNLDDELRQEAEELLTEIDEERQKVTAPNGYRAHVRQYMRQQREQLRNGDREEPLCECGLPLHGCDIKQAQIPGTIQRADDYRAGKQEFCELHPEERVLTEAHQAWRQMKARVRETLREADRILEEAATSTTGGARA